MPLTCYLWQTISIIFRNEKAQEKIQGFFHLFFDLSARRTASFVGVLGAKLPWLSMLCASLSYCPLAVRFFVVNGFWLCPMIVTSNKRSMRQQVSVFSKRNFTKSGKVVVNINESYCIKSVLLYKIGTNVHKREDQWWRIEMIIENAKTNIRIT